MVRGDIQHRTDVRMEFFCFFHLEAADFRNDPILLSQALYLFAVRHTDVTYHCCVRANSFHDFTSQGCGCCFPIGACDGCDGASGFSISQFHFADNFHTCCFCRNNKRQVARDTGTEYNQILFTRNIIGIFPCVKGNAFFFQFQCCRRNGVTFFHILQCNHCTQFLQQSRCCNTAFCHAAYQGTFSCIFHGFFPSFR